MNLSMFGRREILGGRIYFDKEISNVAQTLSTTVSTRVQV